jgi:cytochrome c-type protein NapC
MASIFQRFNKNSQGKPRSKLAVWLFVSLGFCGGLIFLGGFSTALDATNSLEFCVSCHEMRDNVYAEYKQSAHYSSRTGVRVICSDCHVPKDLRHKLIRKVKAANDIYGTLVGSIDTKEKFESKRMEMAVHEWKMMKENDSRECRNCHSFEAMKTNKQKPMAQQRHLLAQQQGKTCIDCHKGIAHLLPKEYAAEDEE